MYLLKTSNCKLHFRLELDANLKMDSLILGSTGLTIIGIEMTQTKRNQLQFDISGGAQYQLLLYWYFGPNWNDLNLWYIINNV